MQVYAPGFRNPFALVKTRAGKLITVDNGPNAGWGDVPQNEGPAGNCTNASASRACTKTTRSICCRPGTTAAIRTRRVRTARTRSTTRTRSRPSRRTTRSSATTATPPNNGSLATLPAGSAGMAEYTASNLANQLNGDLLVGSVKGTVYRVTLDDTGTKVLATEPLFSNLGGSPIDVAVQSDTDPQPGTIWVPNLQLNVDRRVRTERLRRPHHPAVLRRQQPRARRGPRRVLERRRDRERDRAVLERGCAARLGSRPGLRPARPRRRQRRHPRHDRSVRGRRGQRAHDRRPDRVPVPERHDRAARARRHRSPAGVRAACSAWGSPG